MPLEKYGNPAANMALGMTYAEAIELIKEKAYLYEYLPSVFKTAEMKQIMNDYWEDRFLKFYDHYRHHPDEARIVYAQAKAAGATVPISGDMSFDIEAD